MNPRPRIGLVVWGSLGDLHPFLAVALRLRAMGFEPVIATHEDYRAKVEAEGLQFHAVRPSFADIERAFGADRATVTRRLLERPLALFETAIFPFLRQSFDDVSELLSDTRWLVICSPAIGARMAAEARGVPWLAGVLQPMMFLSAHDPPALPPLEWLEPWLRRAGPRATGMALAGVRAALSLVARPARRLRQELGLPATDTDPIFGGQFSGEDALALYSPLIGALQPDMPKGTTVTGFPFYDSEHGRNGDLDPAIRRFLDAGTPPLVYTLGSSFVHSPGAFYCNSAEVARQLGQRAILLVGEVGYTEFAALATPELHVATYAPYSALFPHSAAIIHQGGIGTLGQALRSGRPQLIVPFFGDQPDNAARAARLGVARVLGRKDYSIPRASRYLSALLNDPRYSERAGAVALAMSGEDGAGAAATRIRDWIRSRVGA
jgi:UDP:flavonoid glycosyltransferase YjiC (YdhE family)